MSLTHLNTMQQSAVCAPIGNLLVLAGAGSGKTRVLVQRIGWLVQTQKVSLSRVLAVTFTNKASNQMRERLSTLLNQPTRGMWVGTFHGIAHKMLRLHYTEAKLNSQFVVLDSVDQLGLIRRLLKQKQINEELLEPKAVQSFINRKKDEGIRANALLAQQGLDSRYLKEIYLAYEQHCQQAGMVDFAELLLLSYELLREDQTLRAHYTARFHHVLVDEFQDTNTIQYSWLKLLTQQSQSVTVVGDDDQSIYGWRGARVENIHQFSKDFQNTKIVRLEQNYRSTHTVLAAANALIVNNITRMDKKLWTEIEKGDKIVLYAALNEEDEALYLVRQIRSYFEKGLYALDKMAVLYRSNAQSRVLEEALVRAQIPYRIYGGVRFFERAEIKDALSYLRLALNTEDNATYDRIVNIPPRGLGARSMEIIKKHVESTGDSFFSASQSLLTTEGLTARAQTGLRAFISVILEIQEDIKKNRSLGDIVGMLIEKSGLLAYFENQRGDKAISRSENLKELINATVDFVPESDEPGSRETQVQTFLAHTALEAYERSTEDEDIPCVQLMTIHAAKGLEFPVVFLCGLEEGLFPSYFSTETDKGIEEERRLMYVGITRAMQTLLFSYAKKRRLFGKDKKRSPSRFLKEIPGSLIQDDSQEMKVSMPCRMQQKVLQTKKLKAVKTKKVRGFLLGQRVKHKKFGKGVIIDMEGEGDSVRFNIVFESAGSKWLVLSYAKLEAL